MVKISTGAAFLDALLEGGYGSDIVTTLFGPSGAGIAALVSGLFYASLASESTEYGCDHLKVGLVGASNTVRASYRKDFDELLAEACPESRFFLYAKGGEGPRGQKPLLDALLKDHPDLDYVILDPSANEQNQDTAVYQANVLALAEMVKSKNAFAKVAVLTNTPFKGFSNWSKEYQANVDVFNKDLLEHKLGRADLIDFAVNTYSATEDPPGSDSCGKFCVKDKIHFNTEGEKAVSTAVLNTVFRK